MDIHKWVYYGVRADVAYVDGEFLKLYVGKLTGGIGPAYSHFGEDARFNPLARLDAPNFCQASFGSFPWEMPSSIL